MSSIEQKRVVQMSYDPNRHVQTEVQPWHVWLKNLPQWFKKSHAYAFSETVDKQLLYPAIALTLVGFMMVSSATMDTVAANEHIADAYYYTKRLLVFYVVGFSALYLSMLIPTSTWSNNSLGIFVLGFAGLLLVVLIGTEVNGAKRWLPIGSFFKLQMSEFAKITMMIVMAGYMVRHQQNIRKNYLVFLYGMGFVFIYCAVLYFQKDLGAMIVISAAVCGMFFFCGVRYLHVAGVVALLAGVVTLLIFSSDYRVVKLITFVNPWADPYGDGYQVVQSQIALAQGGWFGVGLGNSVQKLFYLPEPHNDFILSVITEEWGAVGAIVVMLVIGILVFRGLKVGQEAERLGRYYTACLSYGLTLILAAQAVINISVNLRMMPNKGLTLPFVSYGGSSFLACCIILGILLRINIENKKCFKQQSRERIDKQTHIAIKRMSLS